MRVATGGVRPIPEIPMRHPLVSFVCTMLCASGCVHADDPDPCRPDAPWCGPVDSTGDRDAAESTPTDAREVEGHPLDTSTSAPDGDGTPHTSDAGSGSDATDAAGSSLGPDPALSIAEVLTDPEGADGDGFAEFVELAGTADASMTGWTLALVDGRSGDTYATVPLFGLVPDDGLVVIGGTGVAEADAILPAALQQGPDGLVLYDDQGTPRDAVAWGGPVASIPGAVTDRPTEGRSVVRCEQGWREAWPSPGGVDPSDCESSPDTDGSGTDAGTTDVEHTPVPCVPEVDEVRISEVFYDPAGADDRQLEFVELTGIPGTPLDGASFIGHGGDGAIWLDQRLEGVTIDDDGFALVGGAALAPSDDDLAASLQNGPDAITLFGCGVELDTVAWDHDDGVDPGRSFARCATSGWFDADPTPRAANTGFVRGPCRPACDPSTAAIRISELLIDVPGPDDGYEFVELAGPPGARVDGMALVGVNGGTGTPWFTLRLDGGLTRLGRFVIGGESVDSRDLTLAATLQNGPDSLVLVDCDGFALDAVAWGDFGLLDSAAGEGHPADAPSPGRSLTRLGEDTDDNASDFAPAEPTPGW